MNAIVGDNGVVTQAQNANILQSCAMLEEYIQQENFNEWASDMDGYSGVDLLRLKHGNWIYKNDRTGLPFLLINGKIYYLFQKENLPEEIRKSIKGGDAGEKTFEDYSNFKDVYGITSDLKVYYCMNGLDSMIGATDEGLEDSATRVALKNTSGSGLAQYLTDAYGWVKTDANGNVLAENLSSVKELNIDGQSVNNLGELYNLSSLTKLTIKNATMDSLEGIDLAPSLTYVSIENSTINNYSALKDALKIERLYLINVNQAQADGVLSTLKNSTSKSLVYFGIYNSPNVTNISEIDNISSTIKGSLQYLYLYGDSYTTVGFTNFDKLYELRMYHEVTVDNQTSADKTLKSITNLKSKSLQYLYCYGNGELVDISNVNLPELTYLHLQYNYKLSQASIDDFSESKKLRWFYLYRNTNITSIDSVITGNKTLENLQIMRTNVNNIKALKGNTTLTHFYAYNNTSFTTLEGLENCTNIYTIDCSSCSSLGKDCDTTYNDSTKTYTALGKNNKNALYSLQNKTNIYYLEVDYCNYLKYFSYLKNSGRAQVWTCYLYGSNQLDGDEVKEGKPFIDKSAKVTMPANLTTYTIDNNTTAVRLEQQEMTDVDFRKLKNKTNLQSLLIGGMTIKSSVTGEVLNTTQLNSLFNEVLSTCTGLKQFYCYQPINDISFVKNMENLQYIMLYSWSGKYGDCQVGTMYTDGSGKKYHQDASGNPTGLKLLNTYCPKLRSIRIWDYENDANHYIDLSAIQPAINKMDEWAFADNRIDDSIGLWVNNQWVADTISKCTEITNFYAYHLYCITWDLSNCHSLKDVRIRMWDGNWNQIEKDQYRGHIKLPTSYTPVSDDSNPGYYLYMEYPSYNTIISGGAGCREVSMYRVRGNTIYGNGSDEDFARMFAGLNSSYLKKITIRADEIYASFVSSKFLNNLASCTSLSELYYYGYAESSNFNNISPISSMTGLTRIAIENTKISSIPNLTNLTNLSYIDFNYNNITDISGLYKPEGDVPMKITELHLNSNSVSNLAYLRNLSSLSVLDLRNNSLRNTTLSSLFGTVDNVKEMSDLKANYNKLNNLYIRNGNQFDDVSGLSWAKD